jgi:uncharacterized protein (DUF302 family)
MTPPQASEAGTITKASLRSVEETVARLVELLGEKGIKVFAVIDQRAEARVVGLDLRPTTLVVFGNPVAGTPLMQAVPLAALDLPLKVLVWADRDHDTAQVSYTDPSVVAARYGLAPGQAAVLEGVHALTDALIAPS